MTIKFLVLTLLGSVVMNAGLLATAALVDIILSALFSIDLLPICFAIAGIFAGICFYTYALHHIPNKKRKRLGWYIVAMVAILSMFLFFPIAFYSGSQYKLAFKSFAIAQFLMVMFLWKGIFSKDESAIQVYD